jgi:hypothetical protein
LLTHPLPHGDATAFSESSIFSRRAPAIAFFRLFSVLPAALIAVAAAAAAALILRRLSSFTIRLAFRLYHYARVSKTAR